MTEDEQVDAALLAEVTSLLAGCSGAAPTSDEQFSPASTSTTDELLLDSHSFLAETESLLSSIGSNDTRFEPINPTDDKKLCLEEKVGELLADEKRKVRNAQAAKRRLKYRQKLKGEKETLQQQETELSSELDRLQEKQEAARRNQVDNLSLGVWKAIATRQKERRIEAEQTQKQLRAAVVGRARMIHQLDSLLQFSGIGEKKNTLCAERSDAVQRADSVLFNNFIGELDAVYAQTNQIMHEAEFKLSSKLEYKPQRMSKDGVEYFDSADATEIPFDFQDTSRAMSLLMLSDPQTFEGNLTAQENRDTATIKYTVKCQLDQDRITKLLVHSAVRKYTEDGCLVFVWRALSEGQDELSGYQTDETGWLVVRPQTSSHPSTVLESFVRFIPMSIRPEANCKVDTDQFAELAAKSGEEEVNEMMRMLEKMLLGDHRASESPSTVEYDF
ncbi:hypothetical protein P3T76_014950 [Phytophthora citrophthora]|uniref:BZIP domain-containing protein n=1 Tax=Phytophthora citrophthora TaxID=4793 RepID=A0AAD9G0A3_9STRA|nr:hypothetical protein P3T76_014950 [Phytophthora citrophthora]